MRLCLLCKDVLSDGCLFFSERIDKSQPSYFFNIGLLQRFQAHTYINYDKYFILLRLEAISKHTFYFLYDFYFKKV